MNIKEAPYAYVLIIECDDDLIVLSIHPDLDEAEQRLRAHAKSTYVHPPDDDEIVQSLIDEGERVRIYQRAYDKKRKTETFVYVKPFEAQHGCMNPYGRHSLPQS